MRYLILIGLPGSGKTTLSKKLVDKKLVDGFIGIGNFRNLINHYMPKTLHNFIKEDLAWELFRSGINRRHFSDPERDDDLVVINLCGVNGRESSILEMVKFESEEYKIVKLICDKKILKNRVKRRKENQGWFPYEISFEEIIEHGFHHQTKLIKSDLVLHTDRLSKKECIEYLRSVIYEI